MLQSYVILLLLFMLIVELTTDSLVLVDTCMILIFQKKLSCPALCNIFRTLPYI